MTASRWLSAMLVLLPIEGACGAPPAASAPSGEATHEPPEAGKRRQNMPGDCEPVPGQPPPEPLRTTYTGLAAAAQCQREVFTIMGGVTHFLGVPCKHCHQEPDYAADTHNKQIANWMARELVPRLQRRVADAGGRREVWCKDCHAGKPKLLGNPRRRDVAVEWMTTHLVEDFATTVDKPPKCKDCHGGDLGSPEFRAKVILEALPGLPPPAVSPPVAPASARSSEPSTTPVPDFGGR